MPAPFSVVLFLGIVSLLNAEEGKNLPSKVIISNCLHQAPNGIAWVVDDSAAFVINPEKGYNGSKYVPGPASPDDSYHRNSFEFNGAKLIFEWGRVGNGIVGRIESDHPVDLPLGLSSGWPGWTSVFRGTKEGAEGRAKLGDGELVWNLRTTPVPKSSSAETVTLSLQPGKPTYIVAGLGNLPPPDSAEQTLSRARNSYFTGRPSASGELGDFVGAIADNVNNTRIYANNNHRFAHTVSRGWFHSPNSAPYFCWDSFFTANLASIDDPVMARETVRAILSCQSPEGLVPNFGHWRDGNTASMDRSQPPVGSWCVWKMHQRHPDDLDFLAEVYPKLVLWHDWWRGARDGRHDGLLEWGSSTKGFQEAQWETGWDDNLHFDRALMEGNVMNCYAVDLCALWAMDAHYLALIADVLGKTGDAKRFRSEETAMNGLINGKLWNPKVHAYCSRFWDDTEMTARVGPEAFAGGFEGQYFSDSGFRNPAATAHAATMDINWRKTAIPIKDAAGRWSVRWKGTMTAPEDGSYRFACESDGLVRGTVDGKPVVDNRGAHAGIDRKLAVPLKKGQCAEIVLEYSHPQRWPFLKLSVDRIVTDGDRFLTRITPMNFYPLSSGAPDHERAVEAVAVMTDPSKFWGDYLLPTLAYDDPDWHQQNYWRGKVWGPVNYIVWEGIRKFASPDQVREFADRNVALFMKNWKEKGVCGENYLSSKGYQSSDPHYTWGALLCLVGLESIVDVDEQGGILLNGNQSKSIHLKNIPLLGYRFDVDTSPGKATLLLNGKVVLEASGKQERKALGELLPKPQG